MLKGSGVSRGEEFIEDLEECSLCAVEGAKARLEGFKQVVGMQVGLELGGDEAFEGFGEEAEVGDRAVMIETGGVQTR